jgi:hypothetical protein
MSNLNKLNIIAFVLNRNPDNGWYISHHPATSPACVLPHLSKYYVLETLQLVKSIGSTCGAVVMSQSSSPSAEFDWLFAALVLFYVLIFRTKFQIWIPERIPFWMPIPILLLFGTEEEFLPFGVFCWQNCSQKSE